MAQLQVALWLMVGALALVLAVVVLLVAEMVALVEVLAEEVAPVSGVLRYQVKEMTEVLILAQ
jgi:hypothetical protein